MRFMTLARRAAAHRLEVAFRRSVPHGQTRCSPAVRPRPSARTRSAAGSRQHDGDGSSDGRWAYSPFCGSHVASLEHGRHRGRGTQEHRKSTDDRPALRAPHPPLDGTTTCTTTGVTGSHPTQRCREIRPRFLRRAYASATRFSCRAKGTGWACSSWSRVHSG